MYGKVFAQIFDSSIVDESLATRYVWMSLIALADHDGTVDLTAQALARRINLPLADTLAALSDLSQPDPASRSEHESGRRIVLLDDHREWGWRLVNYARYRDIRNQDHRRLQNREAQQRRRERGRSQDPSFVSNCQQSSATVSAGQPQSAHTDAYTEEDGNTEGVTQYSSNSPEGRHAQPAQTPLFGPVGPLVLDDDEQAPQVEPAAPKRKDLPPVVVWNGRDETGAIAGELTNIIELAKGSVSITTGRKLSVSNLQSALIKRDLAQYGVPIPDEPMIGKWLKDMGSYCALGAMLFNLWDAGSFAGLDLRRFVAYVCKMVDIERGAEKPVPDTYTRVLVSDLAALGAHCPSGFDNQGEIPK